MLARVARQLGICKLAELKKNTAFYVNVTGSTAG
uniref:Uncharacterized protein n=1 Tax=Anguilla anguilla TaxID=7936 RepID=A0A0E9VVT6_ANGAN